MGYRTTRQQIKVKCEECGKAKPIAVYVNNLPFCDDCHDGRMKETRKDHVDRIKYIAHAQGYVMVRRPRCSPFVIREADWRSLPLADGN